MIRWAYLMLLNICLVPFWFIHGFYGRNGVLEDQQLPFRRLEEDLYITLWLILSGGDIIFAVI
jgi:hypothetical protein